MANVIKQKAHLAYTSGGSREWHLCQLSPGEDLIVSGGQQSQESVCQGKWPNLEPGNR